MIIKAIQTALSVPENFPLLDETKLGTIPGWDSMVAINVQMELEALSGKNELNIRLTDQMTISDVAEQLKGLGIDKL
jgi:hypothetical protein